MKVRAFRKDYKKTMAKFLSGWSHLVVVVGGSLAISLIALLFINGLIFAELLAVPVMIIVSNFVEYLVHRWPMHQAIKPFKAIFKTHSGKHHRYFDHIYMNIECEDDMHEVFATPLTVFSFMFFIIFPITFISAILISMNVALLIFATCMTYYGLYEFIHFGAHLNPNHFLTKNIFIRNARKRHQIHHNTRVMRECNFNIGFPLMDIIFRTVKK